MRRQQGFTLIELVVTMAVAIILLAVGLPLFQQMQANSRVTSQTNALVSALAAARSEAVGRGSAVAVCAKASASQTDTACGTGAQWINGFEVFLDNGATTGDFDPDTEEVVRMFDSMPGNAQVTASAATIRFLGDGSMDTDFNADGESLLIQQTSGGTYHNCLSLNAMGQVRTTRVDPGDGCP